MLSQSLRNYFVLAKRMRLGRTGTSLKMGLLGMANVGKSSTFNLLSDLNVPAQNIPFCTIEPNTAFITVSDPRFEKLCALYNPQKKVGPILRIVDIAGLVKGASEGFGLGNEFLSNVMQVDGLYHVVRAYPGEQYAHTEGSMDSVRDIEIIRNEIIQKDLANVGKKVTDMAKKAARSQDKDVKDEYAALQRVEACLKNSVEIRNEKWSQKEVEMINKHQVLTAKPMIYLINLSQQDYLSKKLERRKEIEDSITMGGKYATNMILFSVEHEKTVKEQGKGQSEIDNIIKAAYDELEIQHFYTVGTDQVKAWAIRKGDNAQEAAGKIHSDFIRGFINAEVLHADTLLKNTTWKDKLTKNSKKQNKMYIVKDGDIMHFNSKIK